MLTNGGAKYWDIRTGISWKLAINGALSEYYYKNKVRLSNDHLDVVISHHRWALKEHTILELAGARVIGECQVLKLTEDSLILNSKYGMNGEDTLYFQSSKDQKSSIKEPGTPIKLNE